MKRFGIFIFYDKYGTVNEYVKYLLKKMNSLLSECCIVCNGYVTDESRAWLDVNSNYVFYRENKGFDAGAYQDAILNRIGIAKLREFNELVLFNNSFYGPIYSFDDMFEEMEQRRVDFWGITAHESRQTPYHIQSYFLVIEDRLLKSDIFEEYWRTQKNCDIFYDAVENFELKITDFFMKKGFTSSVYIDYAKSRDEYAIDGNLLNVANYELLAEKHCPIVKRKYIMQSLQHGLTQNYEDIMQFIDKQTDYDIGIIWEDLIKEHSPYELVTYRNLNNYLSDSMYNRDTNDEVDDVCIVINSIYPEQFTNYLRELSCKVPIVVCTDDELSECENTMWIKKNGKSLEELLIEVRNLRRNTQYFCVLRDSVISRGKLAEKRRNYNICRQLVSSVQYIDNVKKLFEQQPYLGVLLTEELFDSSFLSQAFYKRHLLEEEAELLKENGCPAIMGEQIINYAGSFWIKMDVLEAIEKRNIVYDHIPEQMFLAVFPYFVKAAGFYSGMLYNVDVAAKEYMWKNLLLNELMDNIVFFDETHFGKQILEESILKFAGRFQDIYIYGAGKYAKKLVLFLERKKVVIKGIIVTSKKADSDFMGYPINGIDEIQLDENAGVIVAMSQRNQKEVEEKMRKHPKKNVYYV